MALSNYSASMDPLLTQYGVDWVNRNKDAYVGLQIAPIVPVTQQQAHYPVFDLASAGGDINKPRAPGEESVGGIMKMSQDTYLTRREDGHWDVPTDNLLSAAAEGAASLALLEASASERAMAASMLRLEKRIVSKIASGIWSTTKTGTTNFVKWSDAASNPVADVRAWKLAQRYLVGPGYEPTHLVLADVVVTNLLAANAEIKDRVKYTSRSISLDIISELLGVRVIEVKASEITSSPGDATTTGASVLTADNGLLLYVNPTINQYVPSALRTFGLSIDGRRDGVGVTSFPIQERIIQRFEGSLAVDVKVVDPALGVFITDIL